MKIKQLLSIRKMKSQLGQLMGIGLLIMIGAAIFIMLFTISMRYEERGDAYFSEQKYADLTLYGTFSEKQIKKVEKKKGVTSAEGRLVKDYKQQDKIYRVITLTQDSNRPYVHSGSLPEKGECLMLKRNSDAINKKTGDTIKLNGETLKISGLISSPEYVYLVQNERASMAAAKDFIVVYTKEDSGKAVSNEMVIQKDQSVKDKSIAAAAGADNYVSLKDQINYSNYTSDLEQIQSFAYIFPGIFALLIAVIIYVMLARTMSRERKQIGICSALGARERQIKGIYLASYILLAIPSVLLGGLIAKVLSETIIGIFASMFEVPGLHFQFYPSLWLIAMFITLAICLTSGFITTGKPLKLLPADAMRLRQPKGGKKIWLEYIPGLWKRFSFHTRYTIKGALRNKARFFAVVIGIFASCALIVFSLGFYNSVKASINDFFDTYVNYDSVITSEPMPLSYDHPAEEYSDAHQRALIIPGEVKGKDVTLTAVDKKFDMLRIKVPGDGVVIPEYYAEQWNVDVGDTIRFDEKDLKIAGIIKQNGGFTIFSQRAYLKSAGEAVPDVYNTLFLRSDDQKALEKNLSDDGFDYTMRADDKRGLDSATDSVTVLIWVLIGCSVILGITVLYSVGLITLSAREYEYMFLGVMGYTSGKIILTQMKESIIQLILAIPLGCIAGRLLIFGIKDAFSTDSFMISVHVSMNNYLVAAFITVVISIAMWLISARYINRLDIVEGLKVQED